MGKIGQVIGTFLLVFFLSSGFGAELLADSINHNEIVERLKDQVEQKQAEIQMIEAKVAQLKEKFGNAEAFITAYPGKVDTAKAKIRQLNDQLASLSGSDPSVLSAKQAEIREAIEKFNNLAQQFKEAKKQVAEKSGLPQQINLEKTNLANLKLQQEVLAQDLEDSREAAYQAAYNIQKAQQERLNALAEDQEGSGGAVANLRSYSEKLNQELQNCRRAQQEFYKEIDCSLPLERARDSWAKFVQAEASRQSESSVDVNSLLKVEGQKNFTDAKSFLEKIIDLLVSLIGLVAFGLLVLAGFRMMLAAGNENEIQKAKALFTHTLVGLGVALAAYLLVVLIRFLFDVN